MRSDEVKLHPGTGLPYALGAPKEISMPELISLLPCGKSKVDADARQLLWDSCFDTDGVGYLSAEDVTSGLWKLLHKKRADDGASDSVDALPAVPLAFGAAVQRNGARCKQATRADLRLLFVWLKWYTMSSSEAQAAASRGPATSAGRWRASHAQSGCSVAHAV